ncbi:unnamed protein product, partial [Rotaria sp. Silwood2]
MEHQHHQTVNDKNNVDDKEFVINYENILEHSTGDTIEEDIQELSKTPIPEIINDENENIDTNEYLKSQVDENAPQQQSSSSVMVTTSDDNRSLSTTTSALTTITTTTTTKADDRASPLNHHTLRENQQVSDRSSPVNGPGLAKPISMTSSLQEQQHQQSRLSSTTNPAGKKRIDAALEKNIETIVTQVRRTTTKPSQLTQNDLQLFDSTTSTNNIRNGHQSRETTPLTSNTIHKQSSSSSREMTPDSINTDSANEDQQQTIRNGHNNQRSIHHPSSNIDLTSPSIPPYGQQQWPPTVYPFAHQHPGLYLPYLSAPSATTSTPTNGLPPFYPSYDPLFIEQHYGPQGLSAFYNQQQQQQARLLQEHSTMSGTTNNTPLFRESQSLTDIFNNPINN